jgi:hypothetical protein
VASFLSYVSFFLVRPAAQGGVRLAAAEVTRRAGGRWGAASQRGLLLLLLAFSYSLLLLLVIVFFAEHKARPTYVSARCVG